MLAKSAHMTEPVL